MAAPSRPLRTPPPAPGSVVVAALGDSVTMSPKEGRQLLFGRNRPEVHVCVGEDDPAVSRRHGILTCSAGRWWLRNTGSRAIRIGESRLLFADEEPVPLAEGYTSLFVEGTRHHLVEVLVMGLETGKKPRPGDPTVPVRAWYLHPEERLVVVVLAEAYLRNEPNAQPASWSQAAALLTQVAPARGWTEKRVEHRVRALRMRLTACGVPGLMQPEVGGSGDVLKQNLIKELIASNTISPKDLALIDPDAPPHW